MGRVPSPYRIQAGHIVLGEKPLAIGSDVLKEEIAECDRINSASAIGGESLAHLRFIFLVGRALRNENLVKRKSQARGLPFEQNAPHAMHADAVIVARQRREQRF